MKIRNRLSLEFTLLTAGIMLLVMVLIYGLFADYVKQVFFHRLRDRALITAQVFLEKDELTKKSFLEIQQKYMQSLPSERSFIFNEQNTQTFLNDSSIVIDPGIIEKVRNNSQQFFMLGQLPAAGIAYNDNQGNFVIIVTARNVSGSQHLNNLLAMLCITYVIGLFVLFIFSKRFAGKALKPIIHVNNTIRQIRSGNLHERVIVPDNKDEINELANNFNTLLEHLEHAFDMQRSFVSNASHELRTPLTSIIGELEVMLNKPRTQEEYISTMRSVLAESEKLTQIINRLFELSNYDAASPRQPFEPVDIYEMMEDIIQDWLSKGPEFKLDFKVNIKAAPWILGNRVLLETAINNVIRNAFKYSDNQPVELELNNNGNMFQISISDKGIGFDAAEAENLFQPFVRGNNARQFPGSGVGLSITQKIIRMHKGTVQAVALQPTGACFHINLPISHRF